MSGSMMDGFFFKIVICNLGTVHEDYAGRRLGKVYGSSTYVILVLVANPVRLTVAVVTQHFKRSLNHYLLLHANVMIKRSLSINYVFCRSYMIAQAHLLSTCSPAFATSPIGPLVNSRFSYPSLVVNFALGSASPSFFPTRCSGVLS